MKKEKQEKQSYDSYEEYEKAYYPTPSEEQLEVMEPYKIGVKIAEESWKKAKHLLSQNK